MKRYPTSLAIEKILIKTTIRYHLIPLRMAVIQKPITNAGEDVDKRELLQTIGGSLN